MDKRDLTELARAMRRQPTLSENRFWQAVRGRRLNGVKFRRQQVIGAFVVDFFVSSHRLVVEIDGNIHCESQEQDASRQQYLEDCGLRVLRFSAEEVEQQLTQVLDLVVEVLMEIRSEPHALGASPPAPGSLTPSPWEPHPQPLSGKRRGEPDACACSPSPPDGEGARG